MRHQKGEIERDQQLLRAYRDAAEATMRGLTRSGIYTVEDYVLDELASELCSIVDRYCWSRQTEPYDTPWACPSDWIDRSSTLGLDMVDLCVHLQRLTDVAAAPVPPLFAESMSGLYRMFCGRSLVDPFERFAAQAHDAAINIDRAYPGFGRNYAHIAGYRDMPGAIPPPSVHFEDRCTDLFERFCRVSDVAVALLREQVQAREAAIKRASRIVIDSKLSIYDDDDDRPKSDAEAAALTRRQSGKSLMDGLSLAARRRWERATRETTLPRVGFHGALERAIWGATGEDYRLALAADDPTVCLIKRRAKVQRWFRPGPAQISYQHAFPVSTVRRLYNSVAFANRQGVVLNVRLGVSWFNVPGCEAADCKHYFAQFKRNLVQWFADKGLTKPYPALVFVHERKAAAGVDRFHTHMQLAVPERLRNEFMSWVDGALCRVLKLPQLPRPVLWVRWRKVPSHSPNQSRAVTRDQWTGLTYMLKGADPGAELGINVNDATVTVGGITEWEYEDPGEPFAGVPYGTTETLGPGSQQAFRDASGEPFHSLLDLQIDNDALDWRELYTDYYLDQAAGRRVPTPPAMVRRRPPLELSPEAMQAAAERDRIQAEFIRNFRI